MLTTMYVCPVDGHPLVRYQRKHGYYCAACPRAWGPGKANGITKAKAVPWLMKGWPWLQNGEHVEYRRGLRAVRHE